MNCQYTSLCLTWVFHISEHQRSYSPEPGQSADRSPLNLCDTVRARSLLLFPWVHVLSMKCAITKEPGVLTLGMSLKMLTTLFSNIETDLTTLTQHLKLKWLNVKTELWLAYCVLRHVGLWRAIQQPTAHFLKQDYWKLFRTILVNSSVSIRRRLAKRSALSIMTA